MIAVAIFWFPDSQVIQLGAVTPPWPLIQYTVYSMSTSISSMSQGTILPKVDFSVVRRKLLSTNPN